MIFDSETSAPVYERIIDVVVSRIREANIYGVEVNRPDREGRNIVTRDNSVIVHQSMLARNEELDHAGNPPAIAFDLQLQIMVFVRNQNEIANEYSSACNRMAALVSRAITKPINDPGLWYQFDGLAVNASFGDFEPFANDSGAHAGVTIPLTITLRVSEDNHFEART